MKYIGRSCRGCVAAAVMLNARELKALTGLLGSYLASESSDPMLPIFRRLHADLTRGPRRAAGWVEDR